MRPELIWIAAGVFLLMFIFATAFSKKFRGRLASIGQSLVRAGKKTSNYVVEDMEAKRLGWAFTAIFKSIFQIVSAPFTLMLNLVANGSKVVARLLTNGGKQIKRFDDNLSRKENLNKRIDAHKSVDQEKKASALFIRGIIAAATQGQGALAKRDSKKAKMICIVILEIVSFITTTIGLMIIASDISPLIAILWAAVVQLLAAYLSVFKGRRNQLILLVVLTVSIGSDFMCYLNAVSPYDAYVEKEYSSYRDSYNELWGQVLGIVDIGSSDATTANAFNDVESAIRDIKAIARAGYAQNLTDLAVISELNAVPQSIPGAILYYDPIFNPITGAREGSRAVRAEPTDNTENYRKAQNKSTILSTISNIETSFSAIGNQAKATQILSELNTLAFDDATQERRQELDKQLEELSLGLEGIVGRINALIDNNTALAAVKRIEGDNLSVIQFKSLANNTLAGLRIASFSEIKSRAEAKAKGAKYFQWLINGFAKGIDSDFINSTIDLRTIAEREMLDRDAAIKVLIKEEFAGSEDATKHLHELADELSVAPIQEPLARAVTLFIEATTMGKGTAEVYSRLFYAFLADGLVLLIGFSLRRKKTTIYRANNRRELNNEQPRLIEEALYSLAARKPALEAEAACGEPVKAYSVGNLMYYLSDFFSNFQTESFVQDPNLNVRFSYVCTDTTVIDTNYKDLVCLLEALGFIKPLSKGQYEYFTEYKRNKVLLEEKESEERLEQLSKSATEGNNGAEKYYLMTTGCALYFSEIMNDLFEHIENDRIRDAINEKFESVRLEVSDNESE